MTLNYGTDSLRKENTAGRDAKKNQIFGAMIGF
jgi:hypothetical protein